VQKGEVTLRHKNGLPLTLWYTAEALRNEEGRISAYSGFFQRRPFGSTSKLADEFARIVDALPGPAWVCTRDHRIAAANDAYLKAYGRTREEVIDHSEYDFLPPDQARLLTTAALKVFEDKQEVLHPAVPHLPDPQIWYRVVRRPIFDDDRREVIGLLGIAQDITDQVLRENAFMERLRTGQKDVVVVADDQGRILRRSAQMLTPSIYGRPGLHEAYTLDMRPMLELIHADDLGAVRRAMHLVLREHSEQYLECRVRNQTGAYTIVQARLIYNDTIYREPRMYVVVRDVTAQAGLRAAPLVIDRLKKATSSHTDRELADFLNISPASISNARKNDRIPADWLIETGRRTGHSIDWLVSGGSALLLPNTNA
jgi:PAS domain S-box-containing protein